MTKCPFMFLLIMHFSCVLSVKKKKRSFFRWVLNIRWLLFVASLNWKKIINAQVFHVPHLGFLKAPEHWPLFKVSVMKIYRRSLELVFFITTCHNIPIYWSVNFTTFSTFAFPIMLLGTPDAPTPPSPNHSLIPSPLSPFSSHPMFCFGPIWRPSELCIPGV